MAALASCVWEGLVTTELNIRLRGKFLRPLLRALVNSGLCSWLDRVFGPTWPAWFYAGYQLEPADVVLSTGGDTLYLNVVEGYCRGRPNVFCGSLRSVDARRIAIVVHTRVSDLPNWLAMEVLPSAVDPEATKADATRFAETRLQGNRDGLWSLLIGGNGSGYRFNAHDVTDLLANCASLAAQHGRRLLVTTSRRTGSLAEKHMAQWLDRHPEAPVAYMVLYSQRPEKVASAFMGLAEVVFCTEDSTSMISESVLNRRPVITLAGENAEPVPDHAAFLEQLAVNGRVRRVQINCLDKLDLPAFQKLWQPYEGQDHRRLQGRMTMLVRA